MSNWIDNQDGLREYPPYRQTSAHVTRERASVLLWLRRIWAGFWRSVTR